MATLLVLRTKLNGEIGVTTDAETTPWTVAVRNAAIIDGYAALWRTGVWKPVSQLLTSVTDSYVYALDTLRRLKRVELLDSSNRVVELVPAFVEDDNAGAWQLRLKRPVASGSTLRVLGWQAYKSQFASDADTDDIPVEDNRLPLLKAKSILWRIQLGTFARYGERQALPPEMNMSIDQLLGMIQACEAEFNEQTDKLSGLRQRVGQSRTI